MMVKITIDQFLFRHEFSDSLSKQKRAVAEFHGKNMVSFIRSYQPNYLPEWLLVCILIIKGWNLFFQIKICIASLGISYLILTSWSFHIPYPCDLPKRVKIKIRKKEEKTFKTKKTPTNQTNKRKNTKKQKKQVQLFLLTLPNIWCPQRMLFFFLLTLRSRVSFINIPKNLLDNIFNI